MPIPISIGGRKGLKLYSSTGFGMRRASFSASVWGIPDDVSTLIYEKNAVNVLGPLQLACALLWMRRRARSGRDRNSF